MGEFNYLFNNIQSCLEVAEIFLDEGNYLNGKHRLDHVQYHLKILIESIEKILKEGGKEE